MAMAVRGVGRCITTYSPSRQAEGRLGRKKRKKQIGPKARDGELRLGIKFEGKQK